MNVIILAAGQGTRMKSALPKVLHPLGGRPLLGHVIQAAKQLKPAKLIVVYGHGGRQVMETINDPDIHWAEQKEQKGTGHAVDQAMGHVDDESTVLVLYGDVPLIETDTLSQLVYEAGGENLALLTVHLDDPTGYGRIARNEHGKVKYIVEQKDADSHELTIKESNTGILAVNGGKLRNWLGQLENNNAQGEYYLTDIIAMAVRDGVDVRTSHPETEAEVEGINSRSQLAKMERVYQRQQAEALMASGVTIIDPARFEVRGEVEVGRDITIDVNVILEGKVRIGDNVTIGANCVITNSEIAAGVEIRPMCVIENAKVGSGCIIGPYSRLRPGADLAGDNHIGNFVEIKNSNIGLGSKVNHLTYIGDTDMGSGVNIGAGTITANYDGANKHRTTIEDNASTGSNSVLIAPVKVGKGATLGAGTILRKDAPEGELTLITTKQKTIPGWKRPKKTK
ncbi:MAG: bifunctional UDP-N-acetylglucosamine diphosphorylase/glucosamine-1-phosphate N-acetyltransferase GlmU [Gammaproteobacteria bacterium]|nr:bifunctional UDP-N-acetylglucosamine diphosphorylase/glucosamine-1-phosphate N-acetyltransferase GlmU [Gammaproteobacteria bacterium]MDH5650516.1 bifunctional UDP-N-acetylglucosamine diphosphorylase/glucosamine-1-phosphate N-acetyltransferase GlmU [Gammaproteobacteria bacterium]